jgi:flavorubredoxin
MNVTLREGIDWVGYVDWQVRDFHGYETWRGSSYNAYLVRDEKTALVDTVKGPYVDELLRLVGERIDPGNVDFVVCNHAEPDHSGGLPEVMRACVNAELVCDARCRDALQKHYNTDGWNFRVVADAETLSLGKRSLTFFETPMVHWPESMFTYVAEEKLLFSMDAFGQHYASAHRFDDEEPLEVLMEEAKTYFANIVMLYGRPIARVMERASGMDIDMIAPSHGVVWRKHVGEIVEAYQDWVEHRPQPKVVVVYDTMWQSTRQMAEAIVEGALEEDVDVRLYSARTESLTRLATEVLDTAAVAFGSPTLNTTLMPQMAAALTYLKGLKPAGKIGFAFGSYGWSKGGAGAVEDYLKSMKVDVVREALQVQFAPTPEHLAECREAGRDLAVKAIEKSRGQGE